MNLGLLRDVLSLEAAKTLGSLLNQPDFSDVTLVCEDHRVILAHKVILAPGSLFFKNILSLNPHPKPLIYLRVKFSDLQEIVRFIYTGRCKVAQDDLDGFLEIAKSLNICGIANNEDTKITKISNHNSFETVNNANDEVSETISELDTVFENQTNDENEDNEADGTFEKSVNQKNNRITREEGTDNVYEVKEELEESAENTGPSCNECKLTFQTDPQLKEHMSRDHMYCCNKLFSSVRSLKSHNWAQRNNKVDESHKTEKSTKRIDLDLHYPETEEKMSFFGSGRKKNQAYDKYFFTFR